MTDYVGLFAGAGGWSVAAERLGLRGVEVEINPAACETLRAAGFEVREGSVTSPKIQDHWSINTVPGLIASPPCQTFSAAGKGAGRAEMDLILLALKRWAWNQDDFSDARTALVLEPARWILERIARGHPYEWIAMEQVPTCLPIWHAYAEMLDGLGYFTAVGILSSEQFGVPQTRKRAILLAHRQRPISLPTPTHSKYYPRNKTKLDPGVLPWVSMATALGWTEDTEVVSNYKDGSDEAWKARFRKFVNQTPTCWEWTGALDTYGYGIFQMEGRAIKAHRLALLGKACREVEELVRHSCDNRRCVRPDHLLLGTPALNSEDMVSRGRSLPGELNPASALTGSQVAEIRAAAAAGETGTSIADRFGVGSSTVYRIIKGSTWTDASNRGRRNAGEPSAAVTSKIDRNIVRLRSNYSAGSSHTGTAAERGRAERPLEEPAFTVGGKGGDQWVGEESRRVSVIEAGILQSFPSWHPWSGTKTERYQQVGNACPVLLAEAVLRQVVEL